MAWNPKANDIFLQALDIPAPERRSGYLDDVCADDTALRAQVDSLLLANDGAGSFLQAPASDPEATTDQPSPPVHDMIIGPYKLLEQIGEGGMGTVFMAEQEHPMRRKVALKLLKPGMDSKQVVARFEAERQALALMDHPNIAHVFDGGTTAAGHPYFVMELVRGIPITAYCDQNRLAVPQRLELFVNVCQAVQHAHQKGIIHRDIKPSNVLVTLHDGTPVVKVIDFGIAKATGQQLTDKTLFTGFAQMIGTPLYMSPEQAGMSGLDVDTRSDIYALGVLLYELLTGTTPFDKQRLREADFDELRRIIREEEPPRPSTRISTLGEGACTVSARQQRDARNLSLLLRGELDWIVMKCLEKDRNRRYETANGLAADVQRYLNDEPVRACPPSRAYRLKKFLRRYKGRVLAASLVLLVLVGGAIGTTIGFLQATDEATKAGQERDRAKEARDAERLAKVGERRQRKGAEAARDRAAAIVDAMTSDFARGALTQQQVITPEQKQFLTQALEYYRELLKETKTNEGTRQRIADVATKVGHIEYHLGRIEEAVVMLRQARDLNEQLAAEFPKVPRYRDVLAAHHHNLGILLRKLGKRDEATAARRAALKITKDLATAFPTDPKYRASLASCHNAVGTELRDRGQAETEYRTALGIYEKLVAEFGNVGKYRDGLASTHWLLGGVLQHQVGKMGDAQAKYLAALLIREKLVSEFPRIPEYRQDLATCHSHLGMLLLAWGKSDRAEKEFRVALLLQQVLATQFPVRPDYRKELAGAQDTLASLLARLGKLDQAEPVYRDARATREQLAAEFPALPAYRHGLAQSRHNLAMVLQELMKLDEAETEFRAALALHEKLRAEVPTHLGYQQDLANHHNALGRLLEVRGKRVAAEKEYRAALVIRKQVAAASPKDPDYRQDLASGHNNLGNLLLHAGKLDLAEKEFRTALVIRRQLVRKFPDRPAYAVSLAGSYCNLGCVIVDRGRLDDALVLLNQAVATLSPIVQKERRYALARQFLFNSYSERAEVLGKLKRYEEAAGDWANVLSLAPAKQKASFQNRLMISRVQAGQLEAALKDADQLARSDSNILLYNCARVYALAHARTKDEKRAIRAIELLRRAIAKGFRALTHLKKDPCLDSLRSRDDFRQLLAEVENE